MFSDFDLSLSNILTDSCFDASAAMVARFESFVGPQSGGGGGLGDGAVGGGPGYSIPRGSTVLGGCAVGSRAAGWESRGQGMEVAATMLEWRSDSGESPEVDGG